MIATVKKDTTVRTIVIEVVPGSVPDIDITRSYHRKPRIFRPDSVTLTLVGGVLSNVNISGGLVLKSGAASTEVRDNERWYTDRELAAAPDWVRELMTEAPQGATSWHQPEAQQL